MGASEKQVKYAIFVTFVIFPVIRAVGPSIQLIMFCIRNAYTCTLVSVLLLLKIHEVLHTHKTCHFNYVK